MFKKISAMLFLTVLFAFVACFSVMAADTKEAPAKTTAMKAPAMPQANKPMVRPNRSNFNMTGGKITKIDNSDPANIKIEVKNESDNTSKTFTILPQTSITKVTDISELKTGDTVRVMSRKSDDKDIAMGVMFGKIKFTPRPTTPLEGALSPLPVKQQAPAMPAAKTSESPKKK